MITPGGRAPASPADLFGAALRGHPVRVSEGLTSRPLHAHRWQQPQEGDRTLLNACGGATLDVGCGPGRLAGALTHRGLPTLGVDIVPEAVRQTRARGAAALLRDVFEPVPAEGRWQTVLLADGNIGIDGDPVRLLRRVGALLVPAGRVVVDLAGPGRGHRVRRLQLTHGPTVSESFAWADVGVDAIGVVAASAGLRCLGVRRVCGSSWDRWFAVLDKPTGRP